jgi:hypothetical protein
LKNIEGWNMFIKDISTNYAIKKGESSDASFTPTMQRKKKKE